METYTSSSEAYKFILDALRTSSFEDKVDITKYMTLSELHHGFIGKWPCDVDKKTDAIQALFGGINISLFRNITYETFLKLSLVGFKVKKWRQENKKLPFPKMQLETELKMLIFVNKRKRKGREKNNFKI